MTRPIFLGTLAPLMVVMILLLWPESTKVSALTAGDIAAFEWFADLGFAPPRGLQPVEVWTGSWVESSGPPRARYAQTRFGFLVRHVDKEFTVASLSLRQRTFLAGSGPEKPDSVHYKKRTLDHIADTLVSGNRPVILDQEGELRWPFEITTGYFFLAWHCWHEGRTDLAERTLAAMRRLPPGWQGSPSFDLRAKFADSLSKIFFENIVVAFTDPKVSREALLARLKKFLRVMPDASDATRAKNLAEALESLIAEERAHPLRSLDSIALLPPDELARELVRHLRNHTQPRVNRNDIPFEQLRQLGDAAVPALIAALDDSRPSRILRGRFKGYLPEELTSIGELADNLLCYISGKQFNGIIQTSADGHPANRTSVRLREIGRWWSDYQSKGRKQFLIDEVASGGSDMCEQTRRLIKEFPAEAGSAIVAGYARLVGVHEKANLLRELAVLDDLRSHALLRQEMNQGETLPIRVMAAHSIRCFHKDSAMEAMLREWEDLRGKSYGEGTGELVRFLAGSGDAVAILKLTESIRDLPPWVRSGILTQLAESYEHTPWNKGNRTSPEIRTLIETSLVMSLHDDQDGGVLYGYANSELSVGDNAASRLSTINPMRYRFDRRASFGEREVARWVCLNAWRAAQGLTPLAAETTPLKPGADRNSISSVVFADTNLRGTAVSAALAALEGRLFRPEDLAKIVSDFGALLPHGLTGLQIRAVRLPQACGVRLKVWSRVGDSPKIHRDLVGHGSVVSAGERVAEFWPTVEYRRISYPSAWGGWLSAVHRAMQKASDTELVLHIVISERG